MTQFLNTFKYLALFVLLFGFVQAQVSTPTVLPITSDSIYIYESNLSYKKNSFGGLLITKREADNLRITLTSKMGMKIFDVVLDKDSLHTIFAVDPLNKKIIKKIIYKDFRMIFPFLFDAKKIKQKKENIIIRKPIKKYKYIYSDGELQKIKKGLGSTRVDINLQNKEISDLEIIHGLIGLKIKIKPLILPDE